MMPCSACRDLLFDHLYGLLDPDEVIAVEKHLTGCPACAAALTRERGNQGLIARAAKVEFPNVRFVPPHEPAPVPSIPASHPSDDRPTHRSFVSRAASWAVAASVLVAVFSTGAWVSGRLDRAELSRSAAITAAARSNEAKLALDRLNRDLASARSGAEARLETAARNRDAALADWVAAEKAAASPPNEKSLAVRVTKPAAIQPGAPNTFVLSVMNGGADLPAEAIFAEVRNQDGRTVYSAQFDHAQQGPHGYFRLPADIWQGLKPDDELFLAIAILDAGTGKKKDIQEPIRLFGPVFTTMLVTDRTDYRAGEPVYFRSLTLDRVTFRPPHREQHLKYELARASGDPIGTVQGSTGLVRVADGRIEPTLGADGLPLRGVGCGTILLPPTLPSGDYVLTLTELPPANGLPPAMAVPVTRVIRVHSGPAERYQKQIGFGAAGYSPGQLVDAWAELKQQDQPVVGVAVTLMAVDSTGRELEMIPRGATGADGRVRFGIKLPSVLPPGDVRVKVTFHTPGDTPVEVAERVPVIGRNLIVEFFPEGGTLVAGVPNRVYVRATTPAGKPVDLRGTITDGEQIVARVVTPTDPNEPGVNRGLGSFTVTPKSQARYWLRLESPTGAFEPPLDNLPNLGALRPVRTGFLLPAVQPDGVVLTLRDPVTKSGQPIRVGLHSIGKDRSLVVGAYIRGRLADTRRIDVIAGQSADVELLKDTGPASGRGGVVRLTVFEDRTAEDAASDLVPVAERLAYRKPAEALNFTLGANGGPLGASPRGFAPGTPIDLSIRAADEQGRPAAAVIYAKVTNAGGTLAAKERLLTSQFLIAGEVQNPDDLEYADFLLSNDGRAAESLDRVLATQGWRRFVEQTPRKPQALEVRSPAAPPSAPERLAMLNGANPVTVDPTQARQEKAFDEKYPRYEAASRDLAQARAAKQAAEADRSREAKARELMTAYDDSRERLVDWTNKAEDAAGAVTAVHRWKWPAIAGLVVAALGFVGFAAVRRVGVARIVPLGLASLGLVGLAGFLGAAVSSPPALAFEEAKLEDEPALKSTGGSDGLPIPAPGGAAPMSVPAPELKARPQGKVLAIRAPEAKMFAPVGPRAMGADNKIADDLLRENAKRTALPKRDATPAYDAEHLATSAEQAKLYARERDAEATAKLQAFPVSDRPAVDRVHKAIVRPAPLVVREYASPRPATSEATPDGPDTLLWKPIIVLPSDGQTTLQFHLGSSPAGYEVIVAGHTPDGRIGAVRGLLPVEPSR